MILDLNDFFDLIRVEMNDAIKGLIDQKLNKLFNHAADPEKYDPAFTKAQNKLRHILHVATIMNGQMLEEAYLYALREKLPRCEVWEDKSFKVSNDALQITTQLNDQRVLETFLPYGECAKIGKKNKTNQVDIIIYDKDKKNITAYEVKRGGSPHDRQKKEKLLGDLIATHVLDVYSGRPGKGIKVDLYYYKKNDQKSKINTFILNNDGMSDQALILVVNFKVGIYEIFFFIGDYFN